VVPACVVALFVGGPAAAEQVPLGGVTFDTEHFELVKRVGVAQRSVIHSSALRDPRARELREGEAKSGLAQLAADLSVFFAELRADESAYPLLRNAILDYRYLRPKDQSAENGRMYIMHIGELYWPFPAPLLADLLRVRVHDRMPQPLKDLLTVALTRWGRDNIDRARGRTDAEERQRVADLIDDLESNEVVEVAWKRTRTVNQLVRHPLDPPSIARLRAAVSSESSSVRAAAVETLGRGGWVGDPEFFANLLEDPDDAVRRAAVWGLLFMRDSRGIPILRDYKGRIDAVAARVRQARAAPTPNQIAAEIERFDQAIGAEPLPQDVLDQLLGAGAGPSILRTARGAVPSPVGSGLPDIVPKAVLPVEGGEPPPQSEQAPAEPVIDSFPP
jgi:hypothetical protein